jgi:hypothetical protein
MLIKIERKIVFLLVIFHSVGLSMLQHQLHYQDQSLINCTNNLNSMVLRIQVYKKNESKSLESESEFLNKCTQNYLKNHRLNELFYFKLVNQHWTLLTNPIKTHLNEHFHIFIFDFRMISNDVVYVDFLNYNYNDLMKENLNNAKSTNIFFNFISNQMVTIHLLNLPKNLNQNLTIILSGNIHLDFSTNTKSNFLNILNLPAAFSGNKSKADFLKQHLQDYQYTVNTTNNKNIIYIEHLFYFCNISHIEINLNKTFGMFLKNFDYNQMNNATLVKTWHSNSYDIFVNYLLQTKYRPLEICSFKTNGQLELAAVSDSHRSKHYQNSKEDKKNFEVFLFNLNDENDALNQMNHANTMNYRQRFFVKECDNKKEYFIILNYLTRENAKAKEIIFENSNCNIKLIVKEFIIFFMTFFFPFKSLNKQFILSINK